MAVLMALPQTLRVAVAFSSAFLEGYYLMWQMQRLQKIGHSNGGTEGKDRM